ncbi:hypothetical protein C8Q80DRAFT_1315080 [Daedaleopsis nitida]|nr:hypothetical protein C8Q80DRAFT_1315080 [Daedaleopsis nitida]
MAPSQNGTVIYKEHPTGYPVLRKTVVHDESQTLDLDNAPLQGGILTKVLVLSINPYLRHKMQAKNPLNPLVSIRALKDFGVGVVLRSDNPKTKAGDHVYGMFRDKRSSRVTPSKSCVIENKEGIPWSAYVSVCGISGQTTHHGLTEFAKPVLKNGHVAFVTAASGTPAPCRRPARQINRTEAAGSDAKVEFVRSLGTDVVFNYKATSTMEVLKREGPINIYWDNIGGESLEAALEYAAHNAHFLICGMILTYDTKEPYNVKNLQNLLWCESMFHGFLGGWLMAKYDKELYGTFPALVASGKF